MPAPRKLASLGMIVVPVLVFACKKGPKETAPIQGWHQEEGWMGSCFYPPDFDALGPGDRRLSWQRTREALMSQWRGDRGDGVQFEDRVLMNAETALLGRPEKVEQVAVDNLEHCQAAMANGSTIAWSNWFDALPAGLTAGECPFPKFDVTLYDYLEIGNEWQIPASLCKDDHVRIKVSEQDYFRIDDKGPWINGEGDRDQPTAGEYACNVEGCFAGQVIMRFTGAESGVQTVQPVGLERKFIAPEHGKLEIMINDTTWYNNTWKVERGIEHHASIEYAPVP